MKRFFRAPSSEAGPARRELPRILSDPEQGLTDAQARELTEAGWDNHPVDAATKSDRQIIREHVFTYFNLIFFLLALCLVFVGDWKDLTFLLIVVANTAIGIVQQIRSKRTIEKLTLLSESKVRTIRGGKIVELSAAALVRDDVIELSAGSQIPADGPVLSGQVQVNEALITGEADPVTKAAGDALLSGSFVISGKCRARMEAVGGESYASRLTLEAKQDIRSGKSEMMRSLDWLIRFIGVALIPIGGFLFYNQFAVQDLGLRQSVVSTVAALIGMIPEGLFLLTSVALAVSVMRLARNRTLIHEMSAIETLARVDVLCVDKTGTITSPQMRVREIIPLDPDAWSESALSEILGAFFRALEPDNDTARALAEKFPQGPLWTASGTVPFTSASKWSAVNFSDRGAYVIGAPDSVMGDEAAALQSKIQFFAEKGCRVLLLAQCDRAEEGRLEGLVLPMALLVLENPIRDSAGEVFSYFHSAGVDVKVISGDHPVTVSAVAMQAGIPDADQWIDARELKTDQEIARAIRRYTVFGRVVPSQKQQIIQALQAAGHTVAMTGDGVNDVLALKDADCGVAMASGADAACQVAQLVLLDSDFAAMPKVVAEGRRVINNIQRASALYLVKNILSFFLAIITLFVDFPYPFLPIQLTLISSLTIGVPSFFLALEPNHDLIHGRFLHNVLRRAFPGGLTAIIVLLFAELFVFAVGLTLGELSTICVILMSINGLTVIYYAAKPLDLRHIVLLSTLSVLLLLAMLWFGPFFALGSLSFVGWLVALVLSLLVVPIQMTFERLFDRCSAWLDRHARKKNARRDTRRTFRNSR